jgi:excisionase family DNA binding protein
MSQTNEQDPLLIPAEVAEMLHIPTKTLYQWRYDGNGPPSHKIGRHLRYRRREVEAWIDKQK